MQKIELGKMDEKFARAFLEVNILAKKDKKNIAFCTSDKCCRLSLEITNKGKCISRNYRFGIDEDGKSYYEKYKLGENFVAIALAKKNARKETFYHETCHVLSANKYFWGVNTLFGNSEMYILDEGFTEFFAKYVYSQNNTTPFKFGDRRYTMYAILYELFFLLCENENIEDMAKMYFRSNIKLYSKKFCKKVFGKRYLSLNKYLQKNTDTDIVTNAVANIFYSAEKKLLDASMREKIEKVLDDYNVIEARNVYNRILSGGKNM